MGNDPGSVGHPQGAAGDAFGQKSKNRKFRVFGAKSGARFPAIGEPRESGAGMVRGSLLHMKSRHTNDVLAEYVLRASGFTMKLSVDEILVSRYSYNILRRAAGTSCRAAPIFFSEGCFQ